MATTTPLEPAFILHRRAYRESSLLLEVFTRDSGRLGLVARGGRGKRRDRATLLQPFGELLIGWSGRGELGTLTHAESGGGIPPLAGSGLFAGFYVNELLLRMLSRFDASPGLFGDYRAVLLALGEGGLEVPLRIFEKRLLEQSGYGLQLFDEVDGGNPVDPDRRYAYLVEQGPCPETVHGGTVVHGRTLLALANERLDDPTVLLEAKRLMRAVLDHHLGSRPLRSRELFTSRSVSSVGIITSDNPQQ